MVRMNAVATIGDNILRFSVDERLPHKAERFLDRELAKKVLVAITVASKLCAIARKYVLEKRKGGEEGRFLRGWGIWYTRGLGAPVWQSSLIWDLDRKQIGQEEAAFIDMLARNQELAEEAETLMRVCDEAIKFDPKTFIREGLSERMADAACKKAVKTVRDAADALAKPTPKPRAPAKVFSPEVEAIQIDIIAKRRASERAQAEKILNRIIEVGAQPNATKEQKKDAERARIALTELDESANKRKVK